MSPVSKETKEKIRDLLINAQSRIQARELAYREIHRSPADPEVRLLLAKSYYLDGLFEFATRELIEVQFLQPTPSVEKLLEQFGEYSKPLIARLKNLPGPGSVSLHMSKDGEQDAAAAKISDEVVADIDVDVDLFDEDEE